MNTADKVDQMIEQWKSMLMNAWEIVVVLAQACIGWPYVFGARGKLCTPNNRKAYARSDKPTIISKCQVLNGSKANCTGCKWHPNGCTRIYDCRGFTYWVFLQVGISIMGAGATSQWNNDDNWSEKGLIKDMPRNKVCCLFKANGKTMEHTGLWLLNDMVIHCSGEVKNGKLSAFTHYAIPKGLYEGGGDVPERKPTLRRGANNDKKYVIECQTDLEALGYDIGKSGIDGVYGKATMNAVKAFQKTAKIGVDGICGPATWAALDDAMKEKEDDDTLVKVVISHITKAQADEIISKYGGIIEKE